MVTSTGGRGGIIVPVRNTGAALIPKYVGCVLDEAVAAPYGTSNEPDRIGEEYVCPVQTVADHTAGAAYKVGPVQQEIGVGEVGTALLQGVSLVETTGAVAISNSVRMATNLSNDGKFVASGTDGYSILTDLVEWIEPDFGALSKTYAVAVLNMGNTATVTLAA